MFRLLICCFVALWVVTGCQREREGASRPAEKEEFTLFTIKKGDHFCDKNDFKAVETADLRFVARFDSSAIYTTANPSNQYDINKLYGFSDNGSNHHQFSARFGWRWSDGALRLFAYIYNNGVRDSKELKAIPIGSPINCRLQVTPSQYRFTVNGTVDSLPRQSKTPLAKGYQLYPYFGGDEPAPHLITVRIRELQ